MIPGWLKVCTCGKVGQDDFCHDCMAFRSQLGIHVFETQAEVRAKASASRGRAAATDTAAPPPKFKGGALSH